MALKRVWKNNTLHKPKTYSNLKTTKDAGSAVVSNDTLLIIGEALTGKKGSSDGIQEFLASQIGDLVSKYTSGPVVDCALSALVPSKTPGIGGPGRFMVFKTNAAVQASLTLDNASAEDLLIVKDRFYGQLGNNVSVTVAAGDGANQKAITIKKVGLDTESLGQNAAAAQLSVQYTGDASTASAVISGASEDAKVFATTLAGDQTDGSANLSITLSAYTMAELADYINQQVGYSATLIATATGPVTEAKELDSVTSANIKAAAISYYRLQHELLDLINDNSVYCEASLAATPVEGVLAHVTDSFLSGGARGKSSSSDFTAGLTKALGKDVNAIVMAISQDAASDIAIGATDAASDYDVSTVQTALDTHLRLRGTIKNGKEAQGYVGFRDADKADVFTQSAALGSELIQLAFQDVKIVDVNANEVWKQPHVLASMIAGMRLGSEIGEPLTYKYIKAVDVKHFVDLTTGVESGDFDPIVDYDEAIIGGATFVEPVSGGFRVVVDNTTYGKDDSFIWNRGSVIEAAFYVAKSSRVLMDTLFIGQKAAGGADTSIAASLKTVLRNHLRDLKGDNILGYSDDAPDGFVEDTFSVRVEGNTAYISVEIKPIQGLDFILIDFTVGSTVSTA